MWPKGAPYDTATDAAGNTGTGTCSFNVTIQDTVAAVITCSDAVAVNQDHPADALVTYAAFATDNSGTVNFTASPSSGIVFPLGATTAAGNTTVCTFIVVSDTRRQGGGRHLRQREPGTFPVTVTAPSSTAGVKVAGSGTITNGSPAAKFKITASVAATGAPKLTFTHTQTGQALKNSSVSAIVKSGTGVKIFGKLRNGKTGPEQDFLLEVRDVAKPGAAKDTYRLSVKGGFQQAQTTIATGEITVK